MKRVSIVMILMAGLVFTSCGSSGGGTGGNTNTVPGAPTSVTAIAGNASAIVSFTAPASDGGSFITLYTVKSNPGSIKATGAVSPITVTGLSNGTAYTFTVTAANSAGTGPSSAASNSVTPAATQHTKAVITLSTAGALPAGTLIGGLDVTLQLPAGVTVASAATTTTAETSSGVVTMTGVAADATGLATYTPASGAVRILLVSSGGFGTGEFATVNCDIASGNDPAQTDFSIPSLTVKDVNGGAISGLSVGFTADIQ